MGPIFFLELPGKSGRCIPRIQRSSTGPGPGRSSSPGYPWEKPWKEREQVSKQRQRSGEQPKQNIKGGEENGEQERRSVSFLTFGLGHDTRGGLSRWRHWVYRRPGERRGTVQQGFAPHGLRWGSGGRQRCASFGDWVWGFAVKELGDGDLIPSSALVFQSLRHDVWRMTYLNIPLGSLQEGDSSSRFLVCDGCISSEGELLAFIELQWVEALVGHCSIRSMTWNSYHW